MLPQKRPQPGQILVAVPVNVMDLLHQNKVCGQGVLPWITTKFNTNPSAAATTSRPRAGPRGRPGRIRCGRARPEAGELVLSHVLTGNAATEPETPRRSANTCRLLRCTERVMGLPGMLGEVSWGFNSAARSSGLARGGCGCGAGTSGQQREAVTMPARWWSAAVRMPPSGPGLQLDPG